MKSPPFPTDAFRRPDWQGMGLVAGWVGLSFCLPAPWGLLCVVVPLCEEAVFRWGLQESMLRRGIAPGWSNLTTALAFALMHGLCRSWLLAAGVLVPALVLGWLYPVARASVGARMAWCACVAGHAVFNACYLLWLD